MPEGDQVARAHGLRNAEVGRQGLGQAGGRELGVLRDFSQQQAHQGQPLRHRHPEAQRAHRRLQALFRAEIWLPPSGAVSGDTQKPVTDRH